MKCQLEDNCEGGSITGIQLCEPDKLVRIGNTKLLDLRQRKSVRNGRYTVLYTYYLLMLGKRNQGV
jgi:hypothetical protein